MKKASLSFVALIPYLPRVSFHSAATDAMTASFACGKMRPKSAWLRLIVIGSPSSNGYLGLYITYNNSNLAIVLNWSFRSESVCAETCAETLRAAFDIVNIEFDQPL